MVYIEIANKKAPPWTAVGLQKEQEYCNMGIHNPTGYRNVKHENYLTIPAWITAECGLTCPHRDIYALIYGWNQGKDWVDITQNYIAEFVGISRRTCINAIKELVDAGWLTKITSNDPRRGTNTIYQVVTPDKHMGVQGFHTPCARISHPPVQTLHTNSSNNNTDNNKPTPNPASPGLPPQGAGGWLPCGNEGENPRNKETDPKIAMKKNGRPRHRFLPPTLEEVAVYLAQAHIVTFTAEEFCNWQQGKGWRGVKDWKAICRSWNDRKRGEAEKGQYKVNPIVMAQKQRRIEHLQSLMAEKPPACPVCGKEARWFGDNFELFECREHGAIPAAMIYPELTDD